MSDRVPFTRNCFFSFNSEFHRPSYLKKCCEITGFSEQTQMCLHSALAVHQPKVSAGDCRACPPPLVNVRVLMLTA